MEELSARSNMYGLLSRILLQELDETTLDTLQNDPVLLEFMPNWKNWDAREKYSPKELLEQHLNPDFTNISLLHLVPYETFYIREDQMIETGGANPVTDVYSAYDFVVDYERARVVSSDHIGVELEFMHHLCEAEKQAFEAKDKAAIAELQNVQYEFLKNHLLRWAPLYLINAKYESRTPLYYETAEMTLEFILSDFELLSKSVVS